jgi:hypothetical protein
LTETYKAPFVFLKQGNDALLYRIVPQQGGKEVLLCKQVLRIGNMVCVEFRRDWEGAALIPGRQLAHPVLAKPDFNVNRL